MSKKSSNKVNNNVNVLKKMGRGIYNAISFIYNLIDSFIIVPITKFMLWVVNLLKTNNKPFDRLLNNKIFLITFSLLIAFVAFFKIDKDAGTMIDSSADILYAQKVTALYNEESYVVEGLPETVDITLLGRRADLYLAKQYPSDDVVIDLRNLKPGKHEVALKYSGAISSVQYKLDPSTASIIIYDKISMAMPITKELLNESKLNSKYLISDISFSNDNNKDKTQNKIDEVYVKGAQYKLDQVAAVKALIDINKIVDPSVGSTQIKDVPLAAYDSKGNKLDVEIVPSTIDANLEITSPYKEVPIKVIPEGEVVFGKAIDKITLSETNATIYGSDDVLSNISYIPVKIDVNKLSETKEYNINVTKPSGVKEISTPSLVVKVTLADVKEKVIKDINVSTKNLGSGYSAQAASAGDSTVDVIVKGSDTNLKALDKEKISAYVDLKNLSEGTHKVKVQITGDDLKMIYEPVKTTVTIVIRKK